MNGFFDVSGYVSTANETGVKPPEHLPATVGKVFDEGATCLAVKCYNAAGTMFRNCLDLATKDLLARHLASAATPPNANERSKLAFRLGWLFKNGALPEDLHEFAICVKDDGNDGAHDGTLGEGEALNLLDFTVHILERIYTYPERLRLAAILRDTRRGQNP